MIYNFFTKIFEDLFVIGVPFLEDFKAVMSARISRKLDLTYDDILSNQKVNDFLEKNLLGYGHASIGELGSACVFHKGFGWITGNILMDDKLFIGQETSTRAVKFNDDMCYDAPTNFKKYHDLFTEIYNKKTSLLQKTKGYKFDDIRGYMPGTFQTGIVINMNLRAFCRLLDKINNISQCQLTVAKYLSGLRYLAPALTKSLFGKQRKYPNRWDKINIDFSINKDILITPPEHLHQNLQDNNFISRKNIDMIDDNVKKLGLFKVQIECPIFEMRDWVRHRTMHPIKKTLLINKENKPFVEKTYTLENNLLINEIFQPIYEKEMSIWEIYKFPLATMLRIEGYITLDYLIYMLELRKNSDGAADIYKKKASQGLEQLKIILGKKYSDFFNL